jgi:ribosomal protein S18 acetylase RimI-like enzyme
VEGPPEPCSIRAATCDDEPFLAALDADRRADDLGSLPLPAEQVATLLEAQYRARRQGYAAAFPAALDVLAVVDDRAVGRLLVDEGPDGLRLVDVAVLRSHRGRGIGTALVRSVLDRAAPAGRPVRLAAAAHDTRVVAWYARLGFSVTDPGATGGPDLEMTWTPGRVG